VTRVTITGEFAFLIHGKGVHVRCAEQRVPTSLATAGTDVSAYAVEGLGTKGTTAMGVSAGSVDKYSTTGMDVSAHGVERLYTACTDAYASFAEKSNIGFPMANAFAVDARTYHNRRRQPAEKRLTRQITRRWTGAAGPVEIKWIADWRPPGQLRR